MSALLNLQEEAEAAGVDYAEVQQALADLAADRTDMATLAGMSDEELGAMYAKGVDFLRIGMHKHAVSVFYALMYLKPFEGRYYRGLGLAFHYMRQFGKARALYGMALVLDKQDTIALALRAECSLYVLSKRDAYEELSVVVQKGAKHPAEIPYIQRARTILSKIVI